MSGIAVIYNLDGRPVDRDLLSRMINAVPYRGPDGIHVWTDGPVGLAHAMMCTTPESLHETQPLVDNDAGLVLTMDGRVDNREELSALLTSKGYRLRDDTDAELVLRAYECWGEDSPGKIIGDFAYAIWDSRRRRLFCARDPLGVRPFHYWTNGRVLACGSDLHQILQLTEVAREPNEGFICEHLTNLLSSQVESMFVGIMRLPAGNRMLVEDQRVKASCYYDLPSVKSISYSNDTEYAEHFLEIFQDAVKCRLRANGKLAVKLSGGVDSSCVAAMTTKLIQGAGDAHTQLEVFTLLPTDPEADESGYFNDVVAMWGLRANRVEPFLIDRETCDSQIERFADHPEFPNGAIMIPIRKQATASGFRVCLTGIGSDEWLWGGTYVGTDLLARGQLVEWLRQMSNEWRKARRGAVGLLPLSALEFVGRSIWPLLLYRIPRNHRVRIKNLLGIPEIARWVNPEFARRVDLRDRIDRGIPLVCESYSKQYLYQGWMSGFASRIEEIDERANASYGFEQRHPFLDRRLVEFAFALPTDQLTRGTTVKFVLRNAVKGLIPESLRVRSSKADLSMAFFRAMHRMRAGDLFRDSEIARRGWIDSKILASEFDVAERQWEIRDPKYTNHMWSFWSALGVDLWFRRQFGTKEGSVREKSAQMQIGALPN